MKPINPRNWGFLTTCFDHHTHNTNPGRILEEKQGGDIGGVFPYKASRIYPTFTTSGYIAAGDWYFTLTLPDYSESHGLFNPVYGVRSTVDLQLFYLHQLNVTPRSTLTRSLATY